MVIGKWALLWRNWWKYSLSLWCAEVFFPSLFFLFSAPLYECIHMHLCTFMCTCTAFCHVHCVLCYGCFKNTNGKSMPGEL